MQIISETDDYVFYASDEVISYFESIELVCEWLEIPDEPIIVEVEDAAGTS